MNWTTQGNFSEIQSYGFGVNRIVKYLSDDAEVISNITILGYSNGRIGLTLTFVDEEGVVDFKLDDRAKTITGLFQAGLNISIPDVTPLYGSLRELLIVADPGVRSILKDIDANLKFSSQTSTHATADTRASRHILSSSSQATFQPPPREEDSNELKHSEQIRSFK